jgi:hypothetical protein
MVTSKVVETDPDTSEEVHKIKLVKPMPVDLPGLVFDAINNLRSALDQAIYALKPVRGKYTYFPFASDAVHFENAIKGRCKNLPQEIRDVLRTFKPYKGGNNLLWALNELANSNKHGIISPVAIASGGTVFKSVKVSGSGSIMIPEWDRSKNEIVFYRVRPGGTFNAQFNFTTFIAIHDVEFVGGQPADAILNKFVSIVEGIVLGIEAEARKIGLF